jgi:hypothetical protein
MEELKPLPLFVLEEEILLVEEKKESVLAAEKIVLAKLEAPGTLGVPYFRLVEGLWFLGNMSCMK